MCGLIIQTVVWLPAIISIVAIRLGIGYRDLGQLTGLRELLQNRIETRLDQLQVGAEDVTVPDTVPDRIIGRAIGRNDRILDNHQLVAGALANDQRCIRTWQGVNINFFECYAAEEVRRGRLLAPKASPKCQAARHSKPNLKKSRRLDALSIYESGFMFF